MNIIRKALIARRLRKTMRPNPGYRTRRLAQFTPERRASVLPRCRGDWVVIQIVPLVVEGKPATALRFYRALMTKMQHDAAEYLRPDGLTADEFINRILEHLDGPEQRRVDEMASKALGEGE